MGVGFATHQFVEKDAHAVRAAASQDDVKVITADFSVEYPLVDDREKGVRTQHFGPFVTVVARGEDVRKAVLEFVVFRRSEQGGVLADFVEHLLDVECRLRRDREIKKDRF